MSQFQSRNSSSERNRLNPRNQIVFARFFIELTNNSGLQVDEDGPRHMFARPGLGEKCGEAVVIGTLDFVRWDGTVGLDAWNAHKLGEKSKIHASANKIPNVIQPDRDPLCFFLAYC